jgi:hypothetical protein
MTETLSEFRQRVARLQTDFDYAHNSAVWHAMLVPVYGATDEQEHWVGKMLSQQGMEAVRALLYADDGADAFLRAAIEAGVLIDDTAPERQAEVCLGVQPVPQVSAVLLRWVEQDDGAKLTLGDVSIAEVYTPIDDADAVWYADSEHRIQPRHGDFPDRATAMRAVEQAFGIAGPLPVEVE